MKKGKSEKNSQQNLMLLAKNRILTGLGYYTIVPILAIVLKEQGVFELSFISLAVALFCFASKGGGLLSFFLYRALSSKEMMMLGNLLAAGGFALIFFTHDKPATLLLLFLSGIGIALNILAIQTYISMVPSKSETRLKNFSLQNVAVYLSSIIGPLIGAALLEKGPGNDPLLIAGLFYFLACIRLLFSFKEKDDSHPNLPLPGHWKEPLKQKAFLAFLIPVFLIWVIDSQLYFSLPLYIRDTFHSTLLVGWGLAVNGIILAAFQSSVTRIISPFIMKNGQIRFALSAGILFMAAGYFFLTLPFWASFMIWPAIISLSIGEMIVFPIMDFHVSSFGSRQTKSAFFTIYTLVCGIGYGASIFFNGLIIQYNSRLHWIVLLIIALLASAAMRVIRIGSEKSAAVL